MLFPPGSTALPDENEERVITGIQATDVTLGLRRIPAGFYAVVHHSAFEWRTKNKRSSANSNIVEWDGLVPIPSDLSATVCLGIYASFEFQPMLGNGEQLRTLPITVEQLLNHSAEHLPFVFFPVDGDVVSPCSSVSVTVGRRKRESDPSAPGALVPRSSTTGSWGQLESATDEGHSALSRYRKCGERRDLEHSIEQFELALNICLPDHPCRATAQSNMAMARLIQCRVDDTGLSLDVPLGLYHDALSARPVGHLDRPSTLIQLAAVHFGLFEMRQDEADIARAEALLHEAMDLSSAESHENRAATSMLQLHARHEVGPAQSCGQPSTEPDSTSGSVDEDLSANLLERFERFGDLEDLQQAISLLEAWIRSASVSDHWYLVGLTNLGMALWYRFQHLGELSDLEQAILRLGVTVDLTPDGHPDKPDRLNIFGSSLLARFEHLGKLSDLEQAISSLRVAIDLTSDGHPDKPDYLNNLGSCFRARFERLGEPSDLEQAILKLRNAVDLTPDGHPGKPSSLNNLANSILTRFEHLGKLSDLEQAMSRFGDAVDLIPDGHSDKPTCLTNLGSCFLARFERLGELSDFEQAMSMFGNAVDFTPDGHPDKPGHLNNLGVSFLTRFRRFGELSDLGKATSRFTDAANLTPDGHPDKPDYLNNLGDSFLARFQHLGELIDLEQAISKLRMAVDLTPDGHPDRPGRLNNLGSCFRARFERLGELSDLKQAISRQTDAVDLIPDGHPDKPSSLNNLANSILTRFERLGELSDLEQAMSRFRVVIDLTPDDHPDKPGYLNNLGSCFRTCSERLGELSDLDQAILRQRDAVDLTPDGHPDKAGRLNNLGSSFLARFERLGELSDLQKAILMLGNAVDLAPDGFPGKSGCLNNLGICFLARFERLGELSDLEQAILNFGNALDLLPDGHSEKPVYLNNLGNSFRARFERLGELSDLEQAIPRQRDAVDLTSDDHPGKPDRLDSLGTSFLIRFQRLGELSDLQKAISELRNAADLTPDGHPGKPGHLDSLGSCLRIRFERLGEPSDLEQAISRHGGAVDLTPDDHPHKSRHLNNLGNALLARFERLGESSDLEHAISRFEVAVDLTPDGHPDKPGRLNNLGSSLRIRFERLREPSDLEHAISRQRDADELTPEGHPDKLIYLSNLGNSFLTRFRCHGELSDLEQAISRQRNAVELAPDGHADKPVCLNNLGSCFRTRFELLGEQDDLEQAISLYSHAARASTGSTSIRFRAAQHWISCARTSGHRSLLHAYSFAIGLLPQLAWIGLSLKDRYRELMQGADVVREAAAAALDSGLPELAVEWLEQGRSIVWGELFQLRSSYDELSAVHPDHALRLRELSAALEHASATREKSMSASSKWTETLEQEANIHRTLAIERDKLLQEIRGLPGFERFLLHKEISQLRTSAHAGPIVILNAAKARCDALIVLADMDNVIHVPLPNFTLERSESLQTSLKSLIRREGKSIPRERPSQWEPILSALWKCVVKQVLDSLAILIPEDLSRIFWCPTGPFTFLPIHAAGFYDTKYSQPGHKIFDFVVSSYVPTLSILTPSPKQDATSSGDLHFLAVRQPQSDGLLRLPGVYAEMAHIKAVIQNSPSARTTLVESSLGTVEEVLDLMKGADWVHFACHGAQDGVNSGLCLADERRLKLSDIITLSRPRGGLAFLSACQTATGDKKLSDEAIHIAAGMLFAGYGGVVGTMWSISDRLAPHVARDVYEQLFRKGMRPNYREAARALQDAVGYLRDGGASFGEWLPFIHVGL